MFRKTRKRLRLAKKVIRVAGPVKSLWERKKRIENRETRRRFQRGR